MNTSSSPLLSLRFKFWLFTFATVAFIIIMRLLIQPLSGEMIIRFELSRTLEKVALILQSWDNQGWIALFKKSIYLDFIFIILYSASFFYGCRFIGRLSGHYILRKAGDGFCWLAPLAGLCDVLENISMLNTVNSPFPSPWVVKFTYHISVVKFSMLMIVALFIFTCAIIWAIDKLSRRELILPK